MLYVAMFVWSMSLFDVVLTLPGIAALILSIGMAVDANVIIFARIKDEICAGKSIRVSVNAGFKNALTTVLDAQITTLIAAVVLYEVGTTSVKGFALTLMIGIVISISPPSSSLSSSFPFWLRASALPKTSISASTRTARRSSSCTRPLPFIRHRKSILHSQQRHHHHRPSVRRCQGT